MGEFDVLNNLPNRVGIHGEVGFVEIWMVGALASLVQSLLQDLYYISGS